MESFIGQISLFGFNFAPKNWALCQGQIMSISQNTALFSLLGTTYGGNGQTTFALPDLRGRAPLGYGQGPGLSNYVEGQAAGTESVTLLAPNMPAHTHGAAGLSAVTTLNAAKTGNGTVTPVAGSTLCAATGGPTAAAIFLPPESPPGELVALGNVSTTIGGTVAPSGNNFPVGIMNPYLALNFSIVLFGIFPSRND